MGRAKQACCVLSQRDPWAGPGGEFPCVKRLSIIGGIDG